MKLLTKNFTWDPCMIQSFVFMTHRAWKTSIIFTGFDHSLRDDKILNGVLVFPSNLLLSFFQILFDVYPNLNMCGQHQIKSNHIYYVDSTGKNGKRNYALSALKWNFWPNISHRILIWFSVYWLMFMTHRARKTPIIFTGFDHSLRDDKIAASSSSAIYSSGTHIWRAVLPRIKQ